MRELGEDLDDVRAALDVVLEEEQAYLDNMPESLQDSEKAGIASDYIDQLEEMIETLESMITDLMEYEP